MRTVGISGAHGTMAGIPGLKSYADNPSRVSIIAAITEAQKELLRAEGMTLSNNLAVNGRSMISILSILVHNGTHIDAPRHMENHQRNAGGNARILETM